LRRILIVFFLLSSLALPLAADPIEDFYAARGSWGTVSDLSTGPGNDFSLFRPADPGAGGVLHPVITWGNGTFSIPLFYFELLDHLASHGFVVIASNSLFTGSGREMLEGVDWILDQNADPASPLFGTMDADAIGATGHSQGGGGAINAGTDPRLSCTAPIQPIPGDVENLQGPMLVLSGTADTIVPPRGVWTTVFLPAPVPKIFALLEDGTHFDPLGDGDGYRGYVTAWFAACLGRNPLAVRAFLGPCTLCDNPRWRVERRLAD
jgi:predicted dienelactone hydrolase